MKKPAEMPNAETVHAIYRVKVSCRFCCVVRVSVWVFFPDPVSHGGQESIDALLGFAGGNSFDNSLDIRVQYIDFSLMARSFTLFFRGILHVLDFSEEIVCLLL
jgi:hypothetical protein